MNDVFVTTADWRTGKALRDIRQRVFIDEQQVPEDLEWDALDETATHFLLYRAEQPVGTGRLLSDGHIGRIAILPEHRGAGLGDQLMRAIIEHAQAQGMNELLLSAQTHAIAFYQRLGFSVCSEVYLDAGIDHQDMCWQASDQVEHSLADIEFVSPGRFSILNPDTESEQATRYPEDDPALTPLNEGNAQALLNELVTACRQQLLVFAPEQAAWLFKRRDFISACEALIARNPKAQIRILLQSVEQEFLSGHTPLALAHRFPSLCQVRRQHSDLPLQPHVQVISDDRGFLMLPKARQREGFVRRDSPDQAKRWGDRFNELWASSQTDPALRRFLL